MRVWFNAYGWFALALAASASSACGMTVQRGAAPRCEVINGEKLPAASGGVTALCAAIERAAVAKSMSAPFSVKVNVGARSILTADVTLSDGRTLPSLRMAEMDRPIGKGTLERFGSAVVDHIAGARR